MKISKSAFTMAELMIVTIVIGFLAIFTLNSLTKASPDRPKMLFKKAYSVVEKAVQELVNDETLYPYNPNELGLINDVIVEIPGGDGTKTTANSGEKFRVLFADKLNIIGIPEDDDTGEYYTFTTTDGIYWMLPKTDIKRGEEYVITVDVNGKDKGPNHYASEHQDDVTSDRFKIYVYFDGKVNVKDEVEIAFLTSHDLKRN